MNSKFLPSWLTVFLIISTIFFWWPRISFLHHLKQPVSLSLSTEIRNAVGEYASDQSYLYALTFLLPKYEPDLQTILNAHKSLFTKSCLATFSDNNKSAFGFSQALPILDLDTSSTHVYLSITCATHWASLLGYALILSSLFTFILFKIPKPFKQQRSLWIKKLSQVGYKQEEAILATKLLDQFPDITNWQIAFLEQLHDQKHHNFSSVLELTANYPLLELKKSELAWLRKALESHTVKEAFKIAQSNDHLILNIDSCTVSIHGWNIPLPKTPFFYYVWYAHLRNEGDGWYKNPQSNKSDKAGGEKLAQLMWKNHGHAKAISDLENNGLRSKSLAQNRSKLKEEITHTLGSELSKPYLFESAKDEGSGQSNYRLALSSEKIVII